MLSVEVTAPAAPAEARLRGQTRLRTAFIIAFSVQILLMFLAFSVSSVLQKSNTRLSEFGDAASGHRVHFASVSDLSQQIIKEAAEANPSSTFIKGMQTKLSEHLEELKSCVVFANEEIPAPWWFEPRSRDEIDRIRDEIKPSLARFIERNSRLASATEAEIDERFTHLSTVDVVSATSGSVNRGLDRIEQISKRSSEEISSLLYLLNVLINSLSILMIFFVSFVIIRPALREQFNAIQREREVSAELREIVGRLQTSENRALKLYEEAREADRVKTEFLAVMSHELRTPLNAINGFSEVLADEYFGKHTVPQYKEYAQDIHNSGIHLLSIINDILNFSRMDIRRVEIAEKQIDLDDTLRTVLRMLVPDAKKSEVTLAPRIVQADDCTLFGDPKLVHQAVLNVATNAIKFSDAGGKVVLSHAVQENGDLHIAVTDQGAGIPEDMLESVTLPFTQAEAAFARSKGGLGLGLAITSAIMQAHGGFLKINSVLGRGTTVELVFPAQRINNTIQDVSQSA